MAMISSSSRSAWWAAISRASAFVLTARDRSTRATVAMMPTTQISIATISSTIVMPRSSRRASPARDIRVPHVEAVLEDDALVVAGRPLAAAGDLDGDADVGGRPVAAGVGEHG